MFQQEVLLNWFCYLVEHYLLKIFYWYLLLGNFVICFWINLVFKIFTFDTCFSFDLMCLFWVNSVYLLYCISRNFCIGVDIKFDIWLNIICSRWFIGIFVGNFVICFWINLVLKIFTFDTYSSFWLDLLVFGSIVFICYVVSAWSSSQLVLIFGWTLPVKDILLISFARKFCNFGIGSIWFLRLLLIYILFLTWCVCFGSIVFICYVVTAGSSSQLVLIFGWTLPVKDILLISFARKFCNLFLDQFGFEDFYFWHMF